MKPKKKKSSFLVPIHQISWPSLGFNIKLTIKTYLLWGQQKPSLEIAISRWMSLFQVVGNHCFPMWMWLCPSAYCKSRIQVLDINGYSWCLGYQPSGVCVVGVGGSVLGSPTKDLRGGLMLGEERADKVANRSDFKQCKQSKVHLKVKRAAQ